MGIPQHFLQDEVLSGLDRLAKRAFSRGVNLSLHTHVNHANQVTPLLGKAAGALLSMGFRDVRNQGVLLRGVNDSQKALLDLCFMLQDHARVLPYYFYMCDMIPSSEHWRTTVAEAQKLQHDIMGYLPGFATPRIVCDVPYVGKRWVHQVAEYDREKGISYWTKNYRTGIEDDGPEADAAAAGALEAIAQAAQDPVARFVAAPGRVQHVDAVPGEAHHRRSFPEASFGDHAPFWLTHPARPRQLAQPAELETQRPAV